MIHKDEHFAKNYIKIGKEIKTFKFLSSLFNGKLTQDNPFNNKKIKIG